MLIGRESVRSQLQSSMRNAARGVAQLVVIEGEAGLGKTELLNDLIAWAPSAGFDVAPGACDQIDHLRPGGVLMRVAGVTPSAAPVESSLYRLLDDVLDVLEARCRERPLLLAVDDLQRADEDTVALLSKAARVLGDRPLCIVATTRPVMTAPAVARLLDSPAGGTALQHVELQPLATGDVRMVVKLRCGAPPDDDLLAHLESAGGNPLFLTELLAALTDDGSLVVRDGRAVLQRKALPLSLRLTILRRLAMLPDSCLELMRNASVLGVAFSAEHLALLTGRTISQLGAELNPALRHGFLGSVADGLSFRHEMVRTALYEDIPEPLRRGLHLQAAEHLSSAHADPVAVAEHAFAGAGAEIPRAVDLVLRAASSMLATNPGSAEGVLRAAHRLSPGSAQIALGLLQAVLTTGRLAGVDLLLEEIESLPLDGEQRDALQLMLIELDLIRARSRAAAERAQRLVTSKGSVPPLAEAAMALAQLFTADYEIGRRTARAALEHADAVADDVAACAALVALALTVGYTGSVESVSAAQAAVERAAREPSGSGLRFQPHNALGMALVMSGRFDEALPVFRAGARLNEAIGIPWVIPLYQAHLAMAQVHSGRIDSADEELAIGREVMRELPEVTLGTRPMLTWSACVSLHRGRFEEAGLLLDEAEGLLLKGLEGGGMEALIWTRALWLEGCGDVGGALARMYGIWLALGPSAQVFRTEFFAADLARIAAAAGEGDVVKEVASSAADLIHAAPNDLTRAAALRCHGIAADDPDALATAVTLLPNAAGLARGYALEELAASVARHGRRDEAVAALRQAEALWEAGGSVWCRNRVRAELRSLGVRGGGRLKGDRKTTGWESLSPAERSVVELVAQGLTNSAVAERLFLSRRTVDTHLAHVYSKLGLSSRTELVREAVSRTR